MITIPNLLLICGSGRHVGKTALLCELIRRHHQQYDVRAIKISPNFHSQQPANALIKTGEGYNIYIEKEFSDKDTSLYMQAGAKAAYYIETEDRQIEKAFNAVYSLFPEGQPILCESGKLRKHFKPAVMIFVQEYSDKPYTGVKDFNLKHADVDIMIPDDKVVTSAKSLTGHISFEKGKWILK